MQEITGRTVIFAQDSLVSMEEVDEECGEQENRRKTRLRSFIFFVLMLEILYK